ncbi:TetR/AcrR family transcriptional regulator [Kutzneria kofuensis]|uniref:AcrR family transcriptional regulator n=1 Tax=Kutzneria kofuensis TaxID=103725 RepID=A0A7W9KS91_9PSEU|nr:TetR/AcrR family transcriptional regulator [Kutzneria kofuensis]MBB5897468.1 AcrR family transcriptional regulator [Kutzneria kofuensis]
MARQFRQQVDQGILDRAAALFAQHGFAHTSLQSLADAVGLSKAGLLHHFPSKDALYAAAIEEGRTHARRALEQVGGLPPGPARDRRAIEVMTDIALDRPGLVALLLRPLTTMEADVLAEGDVFAFEAFAVDPEAGDPDRLIRVTGALGALAVLCLAAHQIGDRTLWRAQIIATCFDALGHERKA